VDAAAVDALADLERPGDVAAVSDVLTALYHPWLEDGANALRQVVASAEVGQAYPTAALPVPEPRTCLLFIDALRYDAGQRLAALLAARGLECRLETHLAALPTVTPTAKPAISPVADRLAGGPDLMPVVAGTSTRVTIDVLRRQLLQTGYQVLDEDETGDPNGRGWTELGAIDAYGHQHGWKVARHLAAELRAIDLRVTALLDAGWRRVVVVTDHGWLMLPTGLPKADLPEHLTVIRKGRCARLKVGATVEYLTVPWRWDPAVHIAVAPGIRCFEAGKEYEHGGLSPQECFTPLITVSRRSGAGGVTVTIQNVSWRGLRCIVQTVGGAQEMQADIRTRAGDPATSLVAGAKALTPDGGASLLARDEDREGEAAFIVLLDAQGALLAQASTIVGG
jgi:hypothetical protein